YAIEKVHQMGGVVVACSDSEGFVVDENGIDLDLVKQIKLTERARISDYAERRSSATYVANGSIWNVPCDIALPSATQNELDEDGARALILGGCRIVAEGANMPTTPQAMRDLVEAGVAFAPGK